MKFLLLILAFLALGATFNGVKTAISTQQRVALVGDIYDLKVERDKFQSDWTALLAEQKALVSNHKIEQAIKEGLELHNPSSTQVVYLDNK